MEMQYRTWRNKGRADGTLSRIKADGRAGARVFTALLVYAGAIFALTSARTSSSVYIIYGATVIFPSSYAAPRVLLGSAAAFALLKPTLILT